MYDFFLELANYYCCPFCNIQIGSSTWTDHLLKIRGINKTQLLEHKIIQTVNRLFLMQTTYNKPRDISLNQANNMLVTFAFTRHPFSRLVSSYYNKVARVTPEWAKTGPVRNLRRELTIHEERRRMMIKYRHLSPKNSNDYPTPKMFVTYLLDEAKKCGSLSFNRHWRPQYTLCPFCKLKFDYIAKIEYMDTHMDYLANLFRFPVILKK